MKKYGIILASGQGSRLHCSTPKQFIKVNNKEIFLYSLETFASINDIDEIILAVNKEKIDEVNQIVSEHGFNKKIHIINGGETRFISTLNCLKYLKEFADEKDIVLIHDSARPLVSENIICSVIENLKDCYVVVPVIFAKDSTFNAKNDRIFNLVNRDTIAMSQTPLGTTFGFIYNLYISNSEDVHEDVSLFLKNDIPVKCIKGSNLNFKITSEEDLQILRKLVEN